MASGRISMPVHGAVAAHTDRHFHKRHALRMRTSPTRLLVLFALLGVLLLPPQTTYAIITPDEPSPPKAASPAVPASTNAPQKPSSTASSSAGSGVGTASPPVTSSGSATPLKPAATETAGSETSNLEPSATAAASATKPATTKDKSGPASRDKAVEKPQTQANPSDKEKEATSATVVEVVHERYVRGRGDYLDDDDADERDSYSAFEIEDSDADDEGGGGRSGGASSGKRQNYASLDAGATILDMSPEMKSPTNLLVPDKDRYMLMPCEKPRKWVVVSLSEDVHADAIAIANFEKFSSTIKDFIVLGSVNYPTDTWFVLGNFTAAQRNGEQIFPLDAQHHVRYIKLRFFSHYGSEYYCTLSQLKMYGRTFTQVISQLEKSIDADVALDTLPALPSVDKDPYGIEGLVDAVGKLHGLDSGSYTGDDDGSLDHDHEPQPLSPTQQCSVAQAIAHDRLVLADVLALPQAAPVCSIQDAPKQSPVKPTTFLPAPGCCDSHSEEQQARELVELDVKELPTTTNAPATATQTPTTGGNASAASVGKSNGSSSATAVAPSPSISSNALHAQGLGRLESIFVRITKKIQQLELNQTVFARQLEETQAQQKALTLSLHAKQDSLSGQMKEMRSMLTEMRTKMDRDAVSNEHYRRLVDELVKENTALWNEMLIVREVITTMKAGILCALVLSACIIVIYLLRLLFRCVKSAKRRADQREWFWRMETLSQQISDNANAQSASPTASTGTVSVDNEPVGAWRLNYKKQFGSSWDDSAIERKTMLSEFVDEPSSMMLQTVDGRQRNKRARTASLIVTPKLKDIMARIEMAHTAAEVKAEMKIKAEPDSDYEG